MAEYVKEHGATLDALKQVAEKVNAKIKTEEGKLSQFLTADAAEQTYAKKTDIASAYIAKGSVENLEGLEGLNIQANVGNVYNVKAAFTTDENFLEGAGKSYPAGTNVVVVDDEETYKFDALSGITDLSDYETAAQAGAKYATQTALTQGLAEKANTSDLEEYVDSGELTTALTAYAKSEDVSDTYETKENVTTGLAGKADKSDLESYVPKTDIATAEEITALVKELFPEK